MANEDVDVQIGCTFTSKTDLFKLNLHRSRSYIHCKANIVFSLILTDALNLEDHWSYFNLKFYSCDEKCLDPNKKSKDQIKKKKIRAKIAECKHRLFYKGCTFSCNSKRLIRIFRPEKTKYNPTSQIRYDGLYSIKSFTDSVDGLSRVFRFVYSDKEPIPSTPITNSETRRTIYKNKETQNSDEDVNVISAQLIKFNKNPSNIKEEPDVRYIGEIVTNAELNFQEASRLPGLSNNEEIVCETIRTDHTPKDNRCSIANQFRKVATVPNFNLASLLKPEDLGEESDDSIPYEEVQVGGHGYTGTIRILADQKQKPTQIYEAEFKVEDEDDFEYLQVCAEDYIDQPNHDNSDPNTDPLGDIEDIDDKSGLLLTNPIGNCDIKSEFAEISSEFQDFHLEEPIKADCSELIENEEIISEPIDSDILFSRPNKDQIISEPQSDDNFFSQPNKDQVIVEPLSDDIFFSRPNKDQVISEPLSDDNFFSRPNEEISLPKSLGSVDILFSRPKESIIEDIEQEVRNDDIICSLTSQSNIIIVVKQLNCSTKDYLLKIVRLKNCFRNFLNCLIYCKSKMESETPPRSVFNVYTKEESPIEITLDDIAVFDDIPYQSDMNHEEHCPKEQCLYNLKFGTIMNIVANKESCPCTWEKEYPKLLVEMAALADYVFFGRDNGKSQLVRFAQSSSHFIGLIKKMTDNGSNYGFCAKRRKIEKPTKAQVSHEEWEEPHIKLFHQDEITGATNEKTFEQITEELLQEIKKIITNPTLKENHPECKKNLTKTTIAPESEFSSFPWNKSFPLPPPPVPFEGFDRKHISESKSKFLHKQGRRLFFANLSKTTKN